MSTSVKCDICRGKGIIKTPNGFLSCQRCAGAGMRDPEAKIDAVETTVVINGASEVVVTYEATDEVVDLHPSPVTR